MQVGVVEPVAGREVEANPPNPPQGTLLNIHSKFLLYIHHDFDAANCKISRKKNRNLTTIPCNFSRVAIFRVLPIIVLSTNL